MIGTLEEVREQAATPSVGAADVVVVSLAIGQHSRLLNAMSTLYTVDRSFI